MFPDFENQPPKKGQFCPANSWAGLPFLFFLKQHTIRRNDRFCMLFFLSLVYSYKIFLLLLSIVLVISGGQKRASQN